MITKTWGHAVLLACLASMAIAASAAERLHYLLFTSDLRPAGEQSIEWADDGLVTTTFVFKDNGRGPELTERMRLANDGTLAEYESLGSSEMGGPVDEHFSRVSDTAQWQSLSERGTTMVSGPAMYMPVNGSFAPVSLALTALAARSDGKVRLVPSGSLSRRQLDEVEVTRDGHKRRVRLVALSGLKFTPDFFWETAEAKPRLFAVIIPGWLLGVEEGWQANLEALAARQRSAVKDMLKDMAVHLRRPMPGLTVIRNVRIFDSEEARLGEASDVYVMRGHITAIVPTGTPSRADHEIDGRGRVLLPGLFDMHVHMDRWQGALHLAAGITTVRDMGSRNDEMQAMLDEFDAGTLLAPRIVSTGFLEGESPYASHSGFVINTFEEAKDAVDWFAQHGYPQLKIYNSFPKEMVPGITAYAHQRGMRVSGHVPAFMRAQEVVEQGFDEIQHINQVVLNFLVAPDTDTRTLARFYLPAERLADLDLDSVAVRDFIALLKRRGTTIDPTLATFNFIRQRDGEMSEVHAPVADHLPAFVRRNLLTGGMKIPDDATAARYRASFLKMIELVGRLHRAGIPLVAGTDDPLAGFALHAEFELYVKAGLSPAQVLQIATRDAARITRTSGDRGSIAVGKLADLVLVDGDPTKNISDIRRIALVITQGSVLSPSALYEALGGKPFVGDEPALTARR